MVLVPGIVILASAIVTGVISKANESERKILLNNKSLVPAAIASNEIVASTVCVLISKPKKANVVSENETELALMVSSIKKVSRPKISPLVIDVADNTVLSKPRINSKPAISITSLITISTSNVDPEDKDNELSIVPPEIISTEIEAERAELEFSEINSANNPSKIFFMFFDF